MVPGPCDTVSAAQAAIGCAPLFPAIRRWTVVIDALMRLMGEYAAANHACIHRHISEHLGAQVLLSVYAGYFGGGVGIVNLAMLSALGMTDIHAMNALKVVLGGVINGVAVVAFIAARAIYWPQAAVTTLGAIVGGYFGAHYSLKMPQAWIRQFVIFVGAAMTIYFFVRGYR